MTNHDHGARQPGPENVRVRLEGLLRDLDTLRHYLEERGRHSHELAQRFAASAKRNTASGAFDERQSIMLEYQHYIWHEIAGRVNQLLTAYGDGETPTDAS